MLHPVEGHLESQCPLVHIATESCDCLDRSECSFANSKCQRGLFTLLVCIQLFHAAFGARLPKQAGIFSLVEKLGLLAAWPGVPVGAFEKFVQISSFGIPLPAKWQPEQPFFSYCDVLHCSSARMVVQPVPVIAEHVCIVASSWVGLLESSLKGIYEIVKAGDLVPSTYRPLSLRIPDRKAAQAKFMKWRPVLMNPHRGFLVESGGRRKWKEFKQMTESDILLMEGMLSTYQDENVSATGHKVTLIDTVSDDSTEYDRKPSLFIPTESAHAWYRAFSHGLEDDSLGASEGQETLEDEADEEPSVEAVDGASMVQFNVASAEQTATGGFRDQLAQFAANYASAQKAEQEQQEQQPKRKSKISSKLASVKENVEDLPGKFSKICWCRGVYMVPLLCVVSVGMGLLGAAFEIVPAAATQARNYLYRLAPVEIVDWTLFLLWMFIFSAIAVALTVHLFPVIAGSGVPEMRAILSGSSLPQYLQTRVLPIKILGVMSIVSSGLWVGKEGPCIHIACLMGSALMRLPIFSPLRLNRTLRRYVLSSCSALGPAGAFGCPIGGVIYSVEATASYFSVLELFYSFITSVFAAIIVRIFVSWYASGTPSFVHFSQVNPPSLLVPSAAEFFWGMMIAVLLGLISPLFIELVSKTIAFRRWLFQKNKVLGHQLTYYLFVLLLSAILFYPPFIGPFMNAPPLRVLFALTLEDSPNYAQDQWATIMDPRVALTVFFLVKTIMLALVIGLPAPTGLFIPTLAAGASFGRLFGEILVLIQGRIVVGGINPWGFAALGAAFLTSGVTHTLSPAIVVIELLGEIRLLIPIMMGTVISFLLSRAVTQNVGIYERLAFDRRLPLIFELPVSKYQLKAEDVMVPIDWSAPTVGTVKVLSASSSLEQIDEILDYEEDITKMYPVVDTFSSRMLLGFISHLDLLRYRKELLTKISNIPSEALTMSSLNLTIDAPQDDARSKHARRRQRRTLLQRVEAAVDPPKYSKVYVAVSPTSPMVLIHQLVSLNGHKTDIVPVCEKGKLLGLIYRNDVIVLLTPSRYVQQVMVKQPPVVPIKQDEVVDVAENVEDDDEKQVDHLDAQFRQSETTFV